MFGLDEDLSEYGGLMLMIVGFIAMFISGIFFGITYYVMDVTQTNFEAMDCVINDNTLVSSCQELWSISLYPFLALKELLIWFSFFFIFALVLGMLISGYQSGRSPVYLGIMITFVGGLTYLGIEISNIYRTMLENPVLYNIMIPFSVYNKIMLNFPWFCFFVGLFSVVLGIVNFQKTIVNEPANNLNY